MLELRYSGLKTGARLIRYCHRWEFRPEWQRIEVGGETFTLVDVHDHYGWGFFGEKAGEGETIGREG